MIQLGYNTLWILCWVAEGSDGSDGFLTDKGFWRFNLSTKDIEY
jgi:hypothetical protein